MTSQVQCSFTSVEICKLAGKKFNTIIYICEVPFNFSTLQLKVRISRQLQVFVFKKGRKSRNIVPLRLTGGRAVMVDPGWTLLMTLTAALLGKY